MFQGLFVDGFAGGGGASTGIAQAIGRDVDIAINHSPAAIAIHKANHPGTEHHCQDIRAIWPLAATRLQPVAGAWFSPDCKEYSKAKGGPVKDRHIRALADEVTVWLRETRPTVAYLENVEEFEYAAPLDEDGVPIKGLEGKAFKRLVKAWRALGFRVRWRKLRACDYGAPTSRKRLYIIMRCDGLPIVWPKPTHGDPHNSAVKSGKLLPYRTAAECIDWSIPCPSIFERSRPLKDATMRRIAHGVMRYVVNAAKPFIVRAAHGDDGRHRTHPLSDPLGAQPASNEFAVVDAEIAPFVSYGQHGGANRPATEPHHTIAASRKDTNGVIGATLYRTRNGERPGQEPRALDPQKPLGTVAAESSGFGLAVAHMHKMAQNGVGKDAREPLDTAMAGATKHAAVTAFLSSFYGSDKVGGGGEPKQPLRTVRTGGERGGGHHAVVAAHIEQANTGMVGHTPRKPLSTIVGKGCTQRIVETTMIEEGALPPEMMERAVRVAAFLVKYYATDGDNEVAQSQAVNRPLDTITTKARFAVVTVTIDAVTYVIVDIGLRMLKPRELARAQGFPEDYVLDPIVKKVVRGKLVEKRLTIAEQISAIGNSVCPPVARALVAANQPGLGEMRLAA
jgi:DNA (cytosine-5)-methyltransferase 1